MPDLSQSDYTEIIEYNGAKYKYNNNVLSLVFLGIDQDEIDAPDSTEFVGASDVMIVLTIDTTTGVSNIIALPREIMVQMDTFFDGTDEIRTEEEHQLYLAYSYGGGGEQSCENAINAISRVLYNVPIEKYYALDMNGIEAINDSVGGVVLKSKIDMPSYAIKANDVITLKGDMTESYVRTRDITSMTSSLVRLDRQVQYVKSFIEQVAPAIMTDFSKIQHIYNAGNEYSRTNISLSDATYLASIIISKNNGNLNFNIHNIEGEMSAYKSDNPNDNDDVYHAVFTPDEDSLMQAVLNTFYLRIG